MKLKLLMFGFALVCLSQPVVAQENINADALKMMSWLPDSDYNEVTFRVTPEERPDQYALRGHARKIKNYNNSLPLPSGLHGRVEAALYGAMSKYLEVNHADKESREDWDSGLEDLRIHFTNVDGHNVFKLMNNKVIGFWIFQIEQAEKLLPLAINKGLFKEDGRKHQGISILTFSAKGNGYFAALNPQNHLLVCKRLYLLRDMLTVGMKRKPGYLDNERNRQLPQILGGLSRFWKIRDTRQRLRTEIVIAKKYFASDQKMLWYKKELRKTPLFDIRFSYYDNQQEDRILLVFDSAWAAKSSWQTKMAELEKWKALLKGKKGQKADYRRELLENVRYQLSDKHLERVAIKSMSLLVMGDMIRDEENYQRELAKAKKQREKTMR